MEISLDKPFICLQICTQEMRIPCLELQFICERQDELLVHKTRIEIAKSKTTVHWI